MENKNTINFATPVVWADAITINTYIENLGQLIKKLSDQQTGCGQYIRIKGAVIDIYSALSSQIINPYPNIDLQIFSTSAKERSQNGMAHWWFTCVERAFNSSGLIDSIFYYPIDVCWDTTADNTVADSLRICEMMKILNQNRETELLIIGNYRSSNEIKEKIEEVVRDALMCTYPNLGSEVKRVRSEYWIVTRQLFKNFKKSCMKNNSYPNVNDPSLLLVLYCLEKKKKVISYDLGYYKVEGTWDSKMNAQIERAKSLIFDFKKGKYCK